MTPAASERTLTTSITSRPASRLAISLASVFAILVIVLLMVRVGQPYYPAPWLDEGLNWGAVRSLIHTGRYGLESADGFRAFATGTQTGPTVILPAVLAFEIFGPGVSSARLVTAVYALLGIIAGYALAYRLLGSPYKALLAVCLLLIGTTEPAASFLPMARQFLGEVPALAWYMAGLAVWLKGVELSESRRQLLMFGLAGLLYGFAGLTKSQMALVLGPSLCLLWFLDSLFFRRTRPMAYVIPIAMYLGVTGVWGAAQIVSLGPEQFALNAELLRKTTLMHVLTFEPRNWVSAIGVLLRTGYLFWGVPTLLWLLFQARRGGRAGFAAIAALVLPVTALVWFTSFSIAWGRYAFYPMTLTALYLAGPLSDLWQATARDGRLAILFRRAVVLVIVATLGSASLPSFVNGVLTARDDGFEAMRHYLDEQMPDDAVVMTWEWQLALESAPRLEFPQQEELNRITDYLRTNSAPPPVGDYLPAMPTERYVLVGPFGGWTGIYDHWIVGREPIARFDRYVLYDLAGGSP